MPDVMLQLGRYQFSVSTAAYQDLARSVEFRWAAQERVGAPDALQFTGPGPDELELRGVIFPFHRGGFDQMREIRAEAARGAPLRLISGRGEVLGQWVVMAVRETQRVFARGGLPRRQEFDLRLRRYEGGGARGLLPF